MRKNAKVLKKRRKNTSKKEDPKKTPKRVPGGPENQLFRARDDFFIPRRALPDRPRAAEIPKSGKNRGFRGQVDKKVENQNRIGVRTGQLGAMRGVCGR